MEGPAKALCQYYAFVHALDGAGAIAFQGDHALRNATGAQTSAWTAGATVEDRFVVAPPANRSPGSFTLRIGVWEPTTAKFLSVRRVHN